MTHQQRATNNTSRREKRHIREDQEKSLAGFGNTHSTFQQGESSTTTHPSPITYGSTMGVIDSQELLQNMQRRQFKRVFHLETHIPNAQCMKNKTFKKSFPKKYAETTIQGNDAYPVYRRRNDNRNISFGRNADFNVDNRWVVPYNPWLLLKYDCHINVEICSSVNSIKYLYKYVYKGPDCVSLEVRPGVNVDEINNYVNGRWLCAPESLWRMFKFQMSRMYPSVERLQIHLPNQHQIQFHSEESISSILMNNRNSKTMLTEYFSVYNQQREQNLYLYRDFPKHYRWFKQQKIWRKRIRRRRVIGRIYSVSPVDSERYYLRMLLNHVPGPKSFKCLLTVNGIHCISFKKAAEMSGLLEQDNSIRECLLEARVFKMPSALR